MKSVRRIIIWILISLAIQIPVFWYLDKYYFATETSFKIKKDVNVSNKSVKDLKISVPSDGKQVSLSYNGKYLSYYQGNDIIITDTKSGTVKKISCEEGAKPSFYKWLPDRNRILLAEKVSSKKGEYFKLYKYDMGRCQKEIITGRGNVDPLLIDSTYNKSQVEDMEMSTLNNELYVKINNGGMRSSIYRIDVNSNLNKVRTNSYFIGNIRLISHKENTVLYEDATNHKVIMATENGSVSVKGIDNPKIIGVDNNDNVYLASVQNDMVTKIYYGDIEKENGNWKQISITQPISIDNIYLSDDGIVYFNDLLRGKIKNSKDNSEIEYNGTFLQVYNGGIASVDSNGILIKKKK